MFETLKNMGFEVLTLHHAEAILKYDMASAAADIDVTELVLFGVKGSMRTLSPGRTQVNILSSRKREHSRKPDEIYDLVEACSPGPYLELFARFKRDGWHQWGNEDVEENSYHGVARRKGHNEPQLRLLEAPAGYRGEG